MSRPVVTTVRDEGEVFRTKPTRGQRDWALGTRPIAGPTEDGVPSSPAPVFPPTRPEDVFGCLRHDGPAKTLEDMDTAISAEARRLGGTMVKNP